MNINHFGLMPDCFNCNAKYKISKSDDPKYVYKVYHTPNTCPFKVVKYTNDEVSALKGIREYNQEMKDKRKMG